MALPASKPLVSSSRFIPATQSTTHFKTFCIRLFIISSIIKLAAPTIAVHRPTDKAYPAIAPTPAKAAPAAARGLPRVVLHCRISPIAPALSIAKQSSDIIILPVSVGVLKLRPVTFDSTFLIGPFSPESPLNGPPPTVFSIFDTTPFICPTKPPPTTYFSA